ncbi:MAG: hypothetical protein KAH01_03975 [Caldisericia bacterium]|nr:hypothetical protein [Caldisericia bacterium]
MDSNTTKPTPGDPDYYKFITDPKGYKKSKIVKPVTMKPKKTKPTNNSGLEQKLSALENGNLNYKNKTFKGRMSKALKSLF